MNAEVTHKKPTKNRSTMNMVKLVEKLEATVQMFDANTV